MKTYDLNEAARILRMNPDTLQRRAKAGLIPGAKPGKCWVFREEALAAYLQELETHPRQASKAQEKMQCSTNVVPLGGWTSPHQTASELDALLAQRTSSRRRSCTTDSKPKRGGNHG